MAEKTTILVTGGAGYIGSHVCKALAAQGYNPVTFDDLSRGHQAAVKWGPLEQGSLHDRGRLGAVLAQWRPVACIHLAAFTDVAESVADPALYHHNNVAGSRALLECLAESSSRAVIFSSSCSVYGDSDGAPLDETRPLNPRNPYAETKLAVEALLTEYEIASRLNHVALRYFNAAGADPEGEAGESHQPETHLIPIVLEAAAGLRPHIAIHGSDYPTPDGTCIRDYVHVADIAEAHVLALARMLDGGTSLTVNLGTGRGASVRQVIAAAGTVTGRPITVVTGPRRPGDPAMLVAEPRRAAAELGWRPRWPRLEDQVDHAWQWLRSRSKP